MAGPACRQHPEEDAIAAPRELSPSQCMKRLGLRGVGRAAVSGATEPQIFPVNYVVDGHSIVFRTGASSDLGVLAPGTAMAFEVDHLETGHRGWSVVASGIAAPIDDDREVDALRERGLEPAPWAPGLRRTYLRLTWDDISGRAVGAAEPATSEIDALGTRQHHIDERASHD